MKKLLTIILALGIIGLPAFAKGRSPRSSGSRSSSTRKSGARSTRGSSSRSSKSKTHVRSYTRKNGTVVRAHNRSAADSTKGNNWSTRGNVNPDTDKVGTKKAK